MKNWIVMSLTNLCLDNLSNFYIKDKNQFLEICSEGQYIVWKSVFKCAERLFTLKRKINSLNYELRPDNYFESCDIVREHIRSSCKWL